MKIIGLLGLINSGKSLVGDILEKEGYKKIAFADSLKDAVSVIFHWDRSLLEGDTTESRLFREEEDFFWSKKLGMRVTPRIILQKYGTEWTREIISDNIWINSLERKISEYDKIVVTDVRFNNEINFLKMQRAKLIQVNRPETCPEWFFALDKFLDITYDELYPSKVAFMRNNFPNVHESEWNWIGNKNIDCVIENSSSKEYLEKIVKHYVNSMEN